MIRGLYTSAMGMITQQKRQENVSNNLANIETNGFKKQEIIAKAFDQMIVKNRAKISENILSPIGKIHLGVMIDGVYTDFEQGPLEETSHSLDLAIQGGGFFTIELPNGQLAYTRDGSFQINENGQLITKQGYLVLDHNLQSISLENERVQIDKNGSITSDSGQKFILNIVNFQNGQDLHRLGENLYILEGGQTVPAENYLIKQGFLEKSNVNPLEELVKMIEITRSFESNQRVIQAMDETLGKAVNEIGRLR
ncbi:flagellar basal-body rod protein FlgF [Garciella nitratireducens]|uniref:Flagellar basal-body rod protein FlgG n=1 Tax=Garciella nitratireducens DSM 15102 TaxID=1121911 RepID=A0A1T4LCF9_9FIRM|nr:flagellar basal-body rod protein FlgF [Garciella nitratireducens]SJZ52375.1 flagellar basal-body rod protein FlgG [Garciella nitratireducens DSM 15102]